MFIDQATIQLIKTKMKKVGWVELPAEGTSMFPVIKSGDRCHFTLCESHLLKRADIALFYTSGQLVAHRLYKKQNVDGKVIFLFKGDTNLGFDVPVESHQIIGKLTLVNRGKRAIKMGKLVPNLWGNLIMAHPIFSDLLQRYLRRKSQFQSGVSS